MNLPHSARVLVALAVLVLSLAALLLVLTISEATLNIQARLAEAPAWLRYGWWGLLGVAGLLVGWLLWRLLRPRAAAQHARHDQPPITAEQVTAAINKAEALGADTTAVHRELAERQRRREHAEIHVALFGEISSGKSALAQALLPQAEITSDVRGGTTRELTRYTWQSPGGDSLLLTDMPGTAEADGTLDRLAADEARRAHIVVYVSDGDLNRSQHQALKELLFSKTTIIISHRITSIQQADRVLVVEKGRIVQEGTAAELAAQEGYYREINAIQAGVEDEILMSVRLNEEN